MQSKDNKRFPSGFTLSRAFMACAHFFLVLDFGTHLVYSSFIFWIMMCLMKLFD